MNVRYLGAQVALVFIYAFVPQNIKEQTVPLEPGIDIVSATARGCQRNTINVANLSALANTTKEKLFVIARLGKGERSQQLSRRRLNDVRTQFGNDLKPSKIVLAEGERVNGQGRIEFYLGSELMSVALMARNGDFCASCCDRRKIFYKER